MNEGGSVVHDNLGFGRRFERLPFIGAGVLLAAIVLGVAAWAGDPPGNVALPGSADEASTILGQKLPEVQGGPHGLVKVGVGIDPPTPSGQRRVHISYALAGKPVVLITVSRGTLTSDGTETLELNGATATVSTKALQDGTVDVAYAWNRNGLAHVLHVNTGSGLTRDNADQIARSVR